jgi:hypothetical protein
LMAAMETNSILSDMTPDKFCGTSRTMKAAINHKKSNRHDRKFTAPSPVISQA